VTKIVNGKVSSHPGQDRPGDAGQDHRITPARRSHHAGQDRPGDRRHDGTSGSLFLDNATKPAPSAGARNFDFLVVPLDKLGWLPALFSFEATSPVSDPASRSPAS